MADQEQEKEAGQKAPSERIGPYRLVRRIGRGGMGEVWLARDTVLKRDVAIKLLSEGLSQNERALKRFLREARAVAKLSHPNVMTIYQIGQHTSQRDPFGRRIFIVTELLEGGSLSEEAKRRGRLAWREATRVIREAAAGLGAAHALGLIHRDIKPGNLMRTGDGRVKVVDFGLARAARETLEVTRPGAVIGTPAFMSPEQGRGQEVDARGDLYSLACTYYALLTARLPFEGDSGSAVIYQHVHELFPDARDTVPDLPQAVTRIIERATRKNPADRYQSAEEMIADLDAALSIGQAPGPGGPSGGGDADTWGVDAAPWSTADDTWPTPRRPTGDRASAAAARTGRNQVLAGSLLGFGVLVVLAIALPVVFWALQPPPSPGPERIVSLTFQQAQAKQREAAAVLSLPAERMLDLGGGVQMKLVLIPAGVFRMGAAKGRPGWHEDQSPPHEVVITHPFYLGATEVTQAQWKAVMGTEPWKGQLNCREGDEFPAGYVSWNDAAAFCRKASGGASASAPAGPQTRTIPKGPSVRLPTEAQWEYACRAGSVTAYWFGDDADQLGQHAWFEGNTEAKGQKYAHPVGQKAANPWGLHDVHGNVWEWCQDWYGPYAEGRGTDPPGPESGEHRVLRGGSWYDPPEGCHVAYRLGTLPGGRSINMGFRVVCGIP